MLFIASTSSSLRDVAPVRSVCEEMETEEIDEYAEQCSQFYKGNVSHGGHLLKKMKQALLDEMNFPTFRENQSENNHMLANNTRDLKLFDKSAAVKAFLNGKVDDEANDESVKMFKDFSKGYLLTQPIAKDYKRLDKHGARNQFSPFFRAVIGVAPVVQVLGIKEVGGARTKCYRLFLSDGLFHHSFILLSTELNHLVDTGNLGDFCLIRLNRCR